jgi:hypothetical protein
MLLVAAVGTGCAAAPSVPPGEPAFRAAEQDVPSEAEIAALQAACLALNDAALEGKTGFATLDDLGADVMFSVNPEAHQVGISVMTYPMDVMQACALGESCARLLDYYAQVYLADDVGGSAGAVGGGAAADAAIGASGAVEDGAVVDGATGGALTDAKVDPEQLALDWDAGVKGEPLGALYDTYDLNIGIDDPDHELDLSGYKPAGAELKIVWQ